MELVRTGSKYTGRTQFPTALPDTYLSQEQLKMTQIPELELGIVAVTHFHRRTACAKECEGLCGIVG